MFPKDILRCFSESIPLSLQYSSAVLLFFRDFPLVSIVIPPDKHRWLLALPEIKCTEGEISSIIFQLQEGFYLEREGSSCASALLHQATIAKMVSLIGIERHHNVTPGIKIDMFVVPISILFRFGEKWHLRITSVCVIEFHTAAESHHITSITRRAEEIPVPPKAHGHTTITTW